MRWQGQRQSTNVEDRRGMGGKGLAVGGGLGTIVLVVLALLMGGDPRQLLEQVGTEGGGQVAQQQPGAQRQPAQDEQTQFVRAALASTEDVWSEIFRQNGEQYREPALVLFEGRTPTACGTGSTAVGPFYCPGDQKVYIDLAFYRDLEQRFRAPGDFAQAYVIAHEIGHHVQNLLGTMDKVHSLQQRTRGPQSNQLSVRLELQADFYAGLWAHHAARRGLIEPGDIDEALRAASAIGDDRLQQQSQGHVVPDSFTHGTSEQRARWFRRGYESGDIRQGDTFGARTL
ncbi:MAG TPA: neutral zinc metallopeptidase [Pyrinomonadaceae bacterium]